MNYYILKWVNYSLSLHSKPPPPPPPTRTHVSKRPHAYCTCYVYYVPIFTGKMFILLGHLSQEDFLKKAKKGSKNICVLCDLSIKHTVTCIHVYNAICNFVSLSSASSVIDHLRLRGQVIQRQTIYTHTHTHTQYRKPAHEATIPQESDSLSKGGSLSLTVGLSLSLLKTILVLFSVITMQI